MSAYPPEVVEAVAKAISDAWDDYMHAERRSESDFTWRDGLISKDGAMREATAALDAVTAASPTLTWHMRKCMACAGQTVREGVVSDLVEFLRARLDEDEAAATRALDPHPDHYDSEWQWVHLTKPRTRSHGWSSRMFRGAPDPARVLAEVAAKRALLEDLTEVMAMVEADPTSQHWYSRRAALLIAVAHLAAVYADCEGYDERWRP